MKALQLILLTLILSIYISSCSENEHSDQEIQSLSEAPDQIESSDTPDHEVEPSVLLKNFIQGAWSKIAQSCDSEGNNCDETPGSDWIFDEENVTLGRISQPYHVSGDTIYVVDSPYEISKEWGDTILIHGINADRYLKLVRK